MKADKPHVVLLYPRSGLDFGSTVAPPHALLTIAAPVLKAGYSVKILDQRTGYITEDVLRDALAGDPICVGISTMTGSQIHFALGLAKKVRRITDKVPIVWGGCHPSVEPEQTLAHELVDIVANGEGDLTLLDIMDALAGHRPLNDVKGILYKDGGKIVRTMPRPLINVEELLPVPWELIDVEKYVHRDMYLREKSRVLDIGQTSRGCPFNCVAESTLIGSPFGLLRATEARQQGSLQCPDGHEHVLGSTTCGDGHDHSVRGLGDWPAVSNGERECLRVVLQNGSMVTVTPGHRIRVVSGEGLAWKEAKELHAGDYVAVAIGGNDVNALVTLSEPNIPHPRRVKSIPRCPSRLTPDVAWLTGFLIGDGCLPKRSPNSLVFAVTEDTKQQLETKLEVCFGTLGAGVKSVSDKIENYWLHSQIIRRFFIESVGVDEYQKTLVPRSIRQSPAVVIRAFLDGLMVADGSKQPSRHPCLTTASEEFAQEVLALSLWIGQPAMIRAMKRGRGAFAPGYDYQVYFCDDQCFLVTRPGSSCWATVIPIERRFYRSSSGHIRASRRARTTWNHQRSSVKSGARRAFLAITEPDHPLLDERSIYVPVRSVESAGVHPVWDVAACPDHQFSADGIMVKNCSFCSSASIRERKWRAMSVEKTIDIIAESVRRFRLDGFWERSDEFYINRKRAHEVFLRMIDLGLNVSFYTSGTRCDVFTKATDEEIRVMKLAGAYTLKFGAESGSQRILDLMHKGITVEQTIAANLRCKKHRITPAFSLMIGYPTETFEDMEKTIDLFVRMKRDNPEAEFETMATYTALPGTPDFHLAIKHGLKPPTTLEGWSNWNFHEYDLEGRRIPWFTSREHRRWIGNINIMSIMANALPNLAVSAKNPIVRTVGRAVTNPVSKYYKWRLKTHRYRVAPELAVANWLREKLFYRGEYTFQ